VSDSRAGDACLTGDESGARVAVVLRRALELALVATLSFGALEVFLRLFHHQVLPQAISNEVASAYHSGWGGLYDFDPAIDSDFFKPHDVRSVYYNGYRWDHRGDQNGFRNPSDRTHVDVVLVGDSMVYGHGLAEADTIRHRLEDELGRPVANLGLQGASTHQEYQIVKHYAVALEPRYVFVCFLYNDISDLTGYLTDDEMRRFVQAPPEQRDVDYFPRYTPSRREQLIGVLRGSYAVRAAWVLFELVKQRLADAGIARGAPLPSEYRDDPRMALATVFHEMAMRRMQLIVQDHGATFVYVFFFTGQANSGEDFYEEVLQRFCARYGIEFLSLRGPLTAAVARGEQPYLAGDGHFSPAGARIVADELAHWIRAREARAAPAAP
jgi:lysophospholipase L1-like esterase